MFDARLVDRVAFFYAPMIIGGRDAVPAIGGRGAERVARALRVDAKPWCIEASVHK